MGRSPAIVTFTRLLGVKPKSVNRQSVQAAIAHEMGHLIDRIQNPPSPDAPQNQKPPAKSKDQDPDVPKENDIINQYDNPIRQELWQPLRMSLYYCGP